MRYFGGKKRLGPNVAKVIVQQIEASGGIDKYTGYWEPFVGLGGVFVPAVASICKLLEPQGEKAQFFQFTASDVHTGVINYWNDIAKGEDWESKTCYFTLPQWEALKATKHELTSMHIIAGHSAGFHGQYFMGKGTTLGEKWIASQMKVAYRCICKAQDVIRHAPRVSFHKQSIFDFNTPRNMVIYCDPPYATSRDSRGFGTFFGYKFDTCKFWDLLTQWAKPELGNLILVSETTVPPAVEADWKVVWSKKTATRMLTPKTELLLVYNKIQTSEVPVRQSPSYALATNPLNEKRKRSE